MTIYDSEMLIGWDKCSTNLVIDFFGVELEAAEIGLDI